MSDSEYKNLECCTGLRNVVLLFIKVHNMGLKETPIVNQIYLIVHKCIKPIYQRLFQKESAQLCHLFKKIQVIFLSVAQILHSVSQWF